MDELYHTTAEGQEQAKKMLEELDMVRNLYKKAREDMEEKIDRQQQHCNTSQIQEIRSLNTVEEIRVWFHYYQNKHLPSPSTGYWNKFTSLFKRDKTSNIKKEQLYEKMRQEILRLPIDQLELWEEAVPELFK